MIHKKFISIFSIALFLSISFASSHTFAISHKPENIYLNTAPDQFGSKRAFRLSTGFLWGEAKELVYEPPTSPYPGHKNSELIWEINQLYMMGAGISVMPYYWLRFNLDGWLKITEGEGTMDDYDWQYIDDNDWSDWSHHEDTRVTKGRIIDFSSDIIFLKTPKYSFRGIIGYKQDNFEWEAWGGSYIYSNTNISGFRDVTGNFSDNTLTITYEQTFDVPYLGLGFSINYPKYRIDTKYLFSSSAQCDAVDHHHLRNLVVYDTFSGGKYKAYHVSGMYDLTRLIKLQAALDYQKYDEILGDSKWVESGTTTFSNDSTGADLETFMISGSVIISF